MISFEKLQESWGNGFVQIPFFFFALELKPVQLQVLAFYYTYDYMSHRGYEQSFAPSENWIARRLGKCRQTVYKAIADLKELGFLRLEAGSNGKRANYHVDLDAINEALREKTGLKKLDAAAVVEEWDPFNTGMTADQFLRKLSEGKQNEPQ